MLHAARLRGPIRGHRRASCPDKQRERFETETQAGAASVGRASRHAAPARAGGAALHPRAIAERLTIATQCHVCANGSPDPPRHSSCCSPPPDWRRLPTACPTHTTGWISTTARCFACIRTAGSNAKTIPTARPLPASGSADARTATWRAYAPTCLPLSPTHSRAWPAANRRWQTACNPRISNAISRCSRPFRTGTSASSTRCRTHSISTPTRASR